VQLNSGTWNPVPANSDPRVGSSASTPCRYDLLFGFGLVSLTLLLFSGWLTYLGLGPWFDQLDFPPYQPPSWLFTPVWSIVLVLLAVATWLVTRKLGRTALLAMGLYGAQCVLNAGWSLLFFTLKRPDVALVELAILDATLALMIFAYARVSRTASLLILPYFLWLLYATAINGWIVAYNDLPHATSLAGTGLYPIFAQFC